MAKSECHDDCHPPGCDCPSIRVFWPQFGRIAKNLRAAVIDFLPGDNSDVPRADERIELDHVPLEEANAISSQIVSNDILKNGKHKVLLDLDVDHCYVPSTTKGHGHLLIDVDLEWEDYRKLLIMLAQLGILQPGYVDASIDQKGTWLRTPWTKKQTA